VYDFLLVINSN